MSKKPPHPRSDPSKRVAREAKKSAKRDAAKRFGLRYSNQAQRGTALAMCALLDIRLRDALRDVLVANDEVMDTLFSRHGLFGELGPKIYVAYAIGLIHYELFQDFRAISNVRNRFAHDPEAHTFDYAPIADECRKIKTLAAIEAARQDPKILKSEDSNLQKFINEGYEMDQVAYQFIAAVSVLSRHVVSHAKLARSDREQQTASS